ncbi:MAG TPA: hypothetical protein EYQ69_03705 [Gemmatimonadetes bacterium]|nr:hypothetical protein [Gemmatimonadota bacterium]
MRLRGGCRLSCYLLKYWRGESGGWGVALDIVLLPIEVVYRLCAHLRSLLYNMGFLTTRKLEVPVISVGNITVGGTGKTPFSRWIFERLTKIGMSPGLISGDWGRDEHLLHQSWNPKGNFVINREKSKGAEVAIIQGADVVIIDDGFQHLQLGRDVDVVLVAAEQDDSLKCLPRGILREPFEFISRADMVIVSRKTASKSVAERMVRKVADFVPEEKIGQIYLEFSCWTDIEGNPIGAPVGKQLVITSIAEPELLIEIVESKTGEMPESEIYRDHHDFTQSDLDYLRIRSEGYNIVITEKDGVKLKKFPDVLDNIHVLRLDMKWERGESRMIEMLRRIEERV